MTENENYWERIPEWLRWILCWPIILIGPLIAVSVLSFFRGTPVFSWESIILNRILVPWANAWLSLLFIFYFLPRYKVFFGLIYTILALVLCLLVFAGIIMQFPEGFSPEFWEDVLDIIQSLIVAFSSIYYFMRYKDEYSNKIHI